MLEGLRLVFVLFEEPIAKRNQGGVGELAFEKACCELKAVIALCKGDSGGVAKPLDHGDLLGADGTKHQFVTGDHNCLLIERRIIIIAAKGLRQALEIGGFDGLTAPDCRKPMTQRIAAGGGFASRGARSAAFPTIESISRNLPL